MRYFILSTPGKPDEVARSLHGVASFYNVSTRAWVSDPLLAAELSLGGAWRPVDRALLPPELLGDDPTPDDAGTTRRSSRRRRRRRGRRRRLIDRLRRRW